MVPSLRPIALLVSLSCFVSLVQAQEPAPSSSSSPLRTWSAELPGGTYIVRLASIVSVSQHEYAVGGTMKVTEVNIVTPGHALARFYAIEPLIPEMPHGIGQSVVDTAVSLAKETTERLGVAGALTRVTKDYPATTHAHTIEYRLESRAGLAELFESISKSWTEGRSGTFRLTQ